MTRKRSRNHSLSFISAVIAILIFSVSFVALAQTNAPLSARATTALPSPPVHFAKAVVYDSGGIVAISVAAADVNADGHPDVIVANLCGFTNCAGGGFGNLGQVDVLLNNGDGTFQAPMGFSTGAYLAQSLVLGGGLMFVANLCLDQECNLDGGVSMMGYYGGVYLISVYDSGGWDPQSIAVGDLDGDGQPDVVVFNRGCATCTSTILSVLLSSTGYTQFGYSPDSLHLYPQSVQVADINGDGKPDIIVGGYSVAYGSGAVSVMLGNGDGTFQPAATYPATANGVSSLAAADVNGDGKSDLIAASRETSVSVLLNNGDGTFRPPRAYKAGGSANFVTVADVNGDGKPDLIVTNAGVSVLPGNGDGTFRAPVSFSSGAWGPFSVAVADVNGDAKPDLIVANACGTDPSCSADSSVGVLLNNSGFTTTAYVVSSLNPSLVNQPITFTAAITSNPPVPNGQLVTFYVGTTAIGTGSLKGGVATVTTSALMHGTSTVKASYTGDRLHAPSSGFLTQIVDRYATSTNISSSLNPSVYGQGMTFTATVTKSGSLPPTGYVAFTWEGIHTIGSGTVSSSGVATLTRSNLNADSYPLTAVYQGDATNAPSTSAILNQLIQQTTSAAAITSSLNPSKAGQSVTFTATITSPTVLPTGPVTFTAGKTVLGTAQLSSGKAKFTTSSLPVGTTAISVTYNGDSNIAKSSASVSQVVQP